MRAETYVEAPHSMTAGLIERIRPTLPLAVGLKDLLARRSRAMWLASAIVVTGTAIVITLMIQSALNSRPSGEISDVPSELPVLIYTLDAVLLLITGTTLLAVTLLSVRERIRDFGVLKAIGFTPTAIAASLVGAHGVLAVIASVVSIPIGLGLYLAAYQLATSAGDEPASIAPWWWLAAVPIVLPIIAILVASIPARIASQISAADAVRYE
jgi:putative ABC transport system permease protein